MRSIKLSLLIILSLAIAALFVPFILSPHKPTPNAQTAHYSASKASPMISNKPNVPAAGSLKFGMDIDSVSPTSIEHAIGAKLNLVGQFVHFNQNLSNNKLAYACQHGYVPFVTWESWNGPLHKTPADPYPLNDIISGKLDSLLRANLQAVKNTCRQNTVLVRFDHEFEESGNYYPWQGDPVSYIAEWQHVVKLGRSIDPNIKWIWSPNRANATSQEYYPGDQWVNYVGLTLNRNGAVVKQSNAPMTFAEFYNQNKAIENYKKPVLIGETTTSEDVTNPNFKAQWITGMFSFVKTDPHIVALIWFNTGSTYAYNSSPQSVQAFKASL